MRSFSVLAVILACLCQTCTADEISSAVIRIEREYEEALQSSGDDPARQFQAKQQFQEKLKHLGQKHFALLHSIKSEKELGSLAAALETADLPVQARAVTDQLLTVDPINPKGHALRVRDRVNHASASDALVALKSAQAVLADENMNPLLPYWGVLGFKFGNENEPKQSIDCFKKYLDSRYELAKTSVEPLPVLPTILGQLRDQYLLIDNHQGYARSVKQYRDRLGIALKLWLSQTESNDESLTWQLHYHVVDIFLSGELEAVDPLGAYERLIRLSMENADLLSQRDDFPKIMKHATQMVISASHRWENFGKEIVSPELSNLTANSKINSKALDAMLRLVRSSQSHVLNHGKEVVKLRDIASKLSLNEVQQPGNVIDTEYLLCLSKNQSSALSSIRSKLSELALSMPVKVFVKDEGELESVEQLMRMLPKPIDRADQPFQVHVMRSPEQWRDIEFPATNVCWLMVKDGRVVGTWLGSSTAKVAQMRWQLSSKTK